MYKYEFKKNPIPDLISDEKFKILSSYNLLDRIRLRSLVMQREYKSLRRKGFKKDDAFKKITEKYGIVNLSILLKVAYGTYQRYNKRPLLKNIQKISLEVISIIEKAKDKKLKH